MDKRRMILDAVEFIFEADDTGTEHPDIFYRRVLVAVETSWRSGIDIEDLVAAARIMLAR